MIITHDYLSTLARASQITELSQKRIINENYNVYKTKGAINYDLFISHSFRDKTKVLALIGLFNQTGYSVYVDWIEDPELDRDNVTKETAALLRSRINSSKGLAYISTQNTTSSKWCPWELGFCDGRKAGRCCILPVLSRTTDEFRGVEYLGLYPHLEYLAGYPNDFVVKSRDTGRQISLSSWLGGTNP